MANQTQFVASAGSFRTGMWWALMGAEVAVVLIGLLVYGG